VYDNLHIDMEQFLQKYKTYSEITNMRDS